MDQGLGTNTHRQDINDQTGSVAAWSDAPSDSASMTNPMMAMPLDASDTELYQLFAGEMFDPSTFENITQGILNGDAPIF
jgi:hypothetical protein